MWLASDWKDYECIDAANGEKLEKWGGFMLCRPDPQVIWDEKAQPQLWNKADAHYHRSSSGGGKWSYSKALPDAWQIHYRDLTFNVKPMGFKHTGLFPEQAVNWDYMRGRIEQSLKSCADGVKVLNLFGVYGGATVACAKSALP